MNEDEKVKGVTILRQEICVLCLNKATSPHAIRVFQNRNPFPLIANIDIGLVKDPVDIGSSDDENFFFVIDSKEKCVWKVERQTGDYHKFLQLPFIHFFRWPSTLSVSCDGKQLLMLTHYSLVVYGALRSEEAAQEELKLPSDIIDPRQAVETSSGHFIVLHVLEKDVDVPAGSTEEEKQLIFVVSKVIKDEDKKTKVVLRFIPQNKTQELNRPCYLALDSDDQVFVADEYNNRIILLDSDLSWVRIICPIDDGPRIVALNKLCYDKVERQLIVVTGAYGREVSIYRIDLG